MIASKLAEQPVSATSRSAHPVQSGVASGTDGKTFMKSRDAEYEQAFLDEAERRGQARHNVPTDGFAVCVHRRLKLGETLYGDSHAYQLKTPSARALEIAEEAWDSAAYAVLDAQARLADLEEDDHTAFHLLEIATLAAAIHSHCRYLMNEDDR